MDKIRPVALIILDGWGHREDASHNAIAKARTPFFDSLLARYPHTLLDASEEYVGLPHGQMGNSEIGHMTMGAGQVIDVDLVKINKAAEHGAFSTNPAFTELFDHVKRHDATLHVMGLVGTGGVHSHQNHLHAFLRAAKATGITKVAVHAITDGRDLPPQSAANHLRELEALLADLGIGFIATMGGRFYAMDRDKNWDRVGKAEAAVFEGNAARRESRTPSAVLEELYKEGVMDEHLEPVVFLDGIGRNGAAGDGGAAWTIGAHDGVFFFNFRPDRARQMTERFLAHRNPLDLFIVTLTEYDKTLTAAGAHVAFPQSRATTSLAAEIAAGGLTQAHIAETEKYAHVTYFFNGGNEAPHKGERFYLIESRKDVATHDLAPEMRAKEIADTAIERIAAGDDFLVVNFANADMVGHTANRPAIVAAVETVDLELRRIVDAILARTGAAIVTADHGNAEMNRDPETGARHTAHTTNLVPFVVASDNPLLHLRTRGRTDAGHEASGTLADIAPTILHLLGLPVPEGMTGRNMIE